MTITDISPRRFPHLVAMMRRQIALFPEHEAYLEKRFRNSDDGELSFCDEIAAAIVRIAQRDADRICSDYRWLTERVIEEELYFRRTGSYRLSSFREAEAEVYANSEYMARYMNGLLASQLWWSNHTAVLRFFRDRFLGALPEDFSHLEIGPGHGLLLAMAAGSPKCAASEGWDVSDASIAKTRAALSSLGVRADVQLRKVDLFAAPAGSFTALTFSEILEHLERPLEALRILNGLVAPGGYLFVNAPVNSPAPDHIFLFDTPEAIIDLLQKAGFVVEDCLFAPCTGANLERARRQRLSISAAIVARKEG